MGTPAAKPRRWAARAACAFFAYHVAAITIANLPRTTALGGVLHFPFDPYLRLAALWQGWDMFTTIPRFFDVRGTLVAVDGEGREVRYGPMLPGLAPHPDSSRIQGVFIRLAFAANAYSGYSDRYLAAICRAVRERTGTAPVNVAFELRGEELRPLADIRRDGRLAKTNLLRFGPAPCAR